MRTVGGTLVSRILGLSKWGGPLSAYYELTQGTVAQSDPSMTRGKILEPSVLKLWEQRSKQVSMRRVGDPITAPSVPYAHASVDAWGTSAELGFLVDSERIILEAKTLALEQAGSEWGPDGSDRLQADYQIQTLWYHGICRAAGMRIAEEALVPVLVGPESELQLLARLAYRQERPLDLDDLEGTKTELRVYRVLWNPTVFDMLTTRVKWFLRKYVESSTPPEPGERDLPARDLNAIAKGTPAEPDTALDFETLPKSARAAVLDLLEANRQRKDWKEKEDQEIARVQLHMGKADEIRGLPGGARVTWKMIKGGSRRFEVREPKR